MSASGSSNVGAACPGCSIANDSIPIFFEFATCRARQRFRRCSSVATYNRSVKQSLLGGLTPREFLRRHWQKRPLYVRGAAPRFTGVLDERQLFALAQRDDV